MRKNIIASILAKVNARMEQAEFRLDMASGRRQIQDARERITPLHHVKETLMELIDANPQMVSEFKFECEGGSPLDTSKCMPSALWTAFASLTHGYFLENDLYDKDNGKPLFDFTSLLGSREEYGVDEQYLSADSDVEFTVVERCCFAQAVFVMCGHLAHFTDNDGRKPYFWLLSMDVDVPNPSGSGSPERQTLHICKPYLNWCIERQQECAPDSKQYHRYAKLIAELRQNDWFLHNLPTVEVAKKTMTTWLYTPCDDGTYDTRHGRIVTRVAERRYAALIDSLEGLDVKEVTSAAKPWELIISAPSFSTDRFLFINSDEWQSHLRIERLQRLEKMAERADEAEAKASRNRSLDLAEYKLIMKLGMEVPPHLAYLATEAAAQAQAAPAATNSVTVNVTQLANPTITPSTPAPMAGVHGTQTYKGLNTKGPRG